jgi:hypothetical protein
MRRFPGGVLLSVDRNGFPDGAEIWSCRSPGSRSEGLLESCADTGPVGSMPPLIALSTSLNGDVIGTWVNGETC